MNSTHINSWIMGWEQEVIYKKWNGFFRIIKLYFSNGTTKTYYPT